MEYPKIIIKYARLLDPFMAVASKAEHPGWVPPPISAVESKVKLFRKEWGAYDKKIFEGMHRATGLVFSRNILDVYIVSGIPRDMSDPIIIRSRYTQVEFVNVLSHELLHRLFAINKTEFDFPEESERVINHIFVFAVLKYLYLDILRQPERVEMDLHRARGDTSNSGYVRAWDIVENLGYENLVAQINKKRASRFCKLQSSVTVRTQGDEPSL